MNCHATRAVLDLYAEKRLTERREQSVSAHLASCAECRARTAAPTAVAVKAPAREFKERLAASLKAARKSPEPRPQAALALWPTDLAGVALTAAALAVVALIIGWSGVPSQRDISGDDLELAAGRMP